MVLTILNSLFFILGGVTVFMLGMEMMGSNLEKAAGRSMRKLMARATRNRFVGVGTGAVVTALVNSSSATTVMIVGFVNVGFMTLTQATSIIMGANIGTTVSALVMALSTSGNKLEVAAIFGLVAFAGLIVTMVGKTDKVKRVGAILEGLGAIFLGLHIMSSAVKDLTDGDDAQVKQAIEGLFISLGQGKEKLTWEIPVLFLIGAVITALMQSSGAVTAIVVTLASSGLITFPMAIFITLGTNVGTCFTSVLSSMTGNANAKRTAVIHLLFNVIGAFIFIIPLSFFGTQLGELFSKTGLATQWQIAIFHMAFNIITTMILLPFRDQLVKLACLLVKDKKGEDTQPMEILDNRLLKSPPIAVGQTRAEIVRMANMAFENYKRSLDMLLSLDLSQQETFDKTEDDINKLNKYITAFCVKLSSRDITETDEKKVGSFYHVVSDLERIGDYAQNITEYAQVMANDQLHFSEHAREEILQMDGHLTKLFGYVSQAFADRDLQNAAEIEKEEQATDDLKEQMKASHIRRVSEGRCDAETGSIFLQLAADMERIGDHMKNISNSVKDYVR